MLKDINRPEVENLAVAVVKETDEQGSEVWNVYVINLYDKPIDGVLVSSKGYGDFEGKSVKTSVLRHLIGKIDAKDYAKVEPIMTNLFGLSNEYWVSFYLDKNIYDKKYVFLPDSIQETNFIKLPVLNKKGVMIK
ncbi:MAG: hypothetical protein RIQ89_141 [Bacteroidota bacterium]|jgi:hypothetical protein